MPSVPSVVDYWQADCSISHILFTSSPYRPLWPSSSHCRKSTLLHALTDYAQPPAHGHFDATTVTATNGAIRLDRQSPRFFFSPAEHVARFVPTKTLEIPTRIGKKPTCDVHVGKRGLTPAAAPSFVPSPSAQHIPQPKAERVCWANEAVREGAGSKSWCAHKDLLRTLSLEHGAKEVTWMRMADLQSWGLTALCLLPPTFSLPAMAGPALREGPWPPERFRSNGICPRRVGV